jgi:O-antigen/teichoic acid export membrane protein
MGTSSQGIFSAMAYTMTVAYLCMEAVGYSAIARLSRYYVSNRRHYLRLLTKIVTVSLFMGLFAVLIAGFAGRYILTLLYSPEYAEESDVFVWLIVVVAGKMILSMLNHGMNAARYFKVQVPLNLFGLLVATIGCVVLVPPYGMIGAAWAMLAGVAVRILGSLIVIALAVHSKTIKTGTR